MAFLDFYTFDLTAIVIILLFSLAVFSALNYMDEEKEENYTFNVSVALFLGFMASIFYSYITLESDDILTSNYWD